MKREQLNALFRRYDCLRYKVIQTSHPDESAKALDDAEAIRNDILAEFDRLTDERAKLLDHLRWVVAVMPDPELDNDKVQAGIVRDAINAIIGMGEKP